MIAAAVDDDMAKCVKRELLHQKAQWLSCSLWATYVLHQKQLYTSKEERRRPRAWETMRQRSGQRRSTRKSLLQCCRGM